jgi:hypothetical protein
VTSGDDDPPQIGNDGSFEMVPPDDQAYVVLTLRTAESDGLRINAYFCKPKCQSHKLPFFRVPETFNPDDIIKVCTRSTDERAQQTERYMECRAAYKFYKDNNALGWKAARAALWGWSEAAYQLQEYRFKGFPIFARDKEVEEEIVSAVQRPEFLTFVNQPKTYFQGNTQKLDVGVLRQTEYLIYLRESGEMARAQSLAAEIAAHVKVLADRGDLTAQQKTDLDFVRGITSSFGANLAAGPAGAFTGPVAARDSP